MKTRNLVFLLSIVFAWVAGAWIAHGLCLALWPTGEFTQFLAISTAIVVWLAYGYIASEYLDSWINRKSGW